METQTGANTAPKGLNRKAFIFIVVTTFLTSIGFGLITPVAPFLVTRYVTDPNSVGLALGWLTAAYSICQFIAAPGLGALSDRFGRKPILLFCMLGSAIGYLMLGVGGALWVLFLGRIIDGITGANLSVSFAYIADVTPSEERGKYFGWVGALAGIGFIIGPVIGGLVAKLGYEAPFYAAAVVTFLNLIYGLFFMPESLPPEQRSKQISLVGLNPFGVLRGVFAIPQLRWLLVGVFLYSLPFAVLQSNIGLYVKDSLGWDADTTGIIFAMVGITDIIVQGVLLGRMLKWFGESRVAIGGMVCEIIGYVLIGSVAVFHSAVPMFAGVIVFALGDGLLGPSLSGLLSRAASAGEQGQVQGGSQAVQSLGRIGGPLIGGELYDRAGHAVPYVTGAAVVAVAIGFVSLALPSLAKHTQSGQEASPVGAD
jgi:DHA1 family tetracycline resistance protein-like MFS transporter